MSFTASTVRRVLYEGGPARFLYAIGNTQARAVLPAGQGPLEGTIRVIASSIDPNNSYDLQFLWGMWFNAALSQEHRARLEALLQQVLQGQLPAHIALADAPTDSSSSSSSSSGSPKPLLVRLQAIWKVWLGCNKSLQVVAAARCNFMLENANRRRQGAGCKDKLSWQELVSFNSLETVLDRVVQDYYTLKESVKASMQAELKVYLEHGSILESGLACKGPSVNPTLLDESCTWGVHDSCWPFDCFPPISQQQIKAGTHSLPGLLTRLAQGALRGMVQQYQQAAGLAPGNASGSSSSGGGRGSNVKFVVHGGDGVGLCAAGSSLGDETRFNAIDSSNVGDHAGLLNVLLATGPRLVPDPRSRIHIDTMIWQNGGDPNLPAYLSKSFGGSASFIPTFTGLRLCLETRFGRLQPYSMHDFIASRSSNTRQLEFAPAVASAEAALVLRPVSSSSNSNCTTAAGGSQQAAGASLVASATQLPPKKSSISSSSSSSVKEHTLADALLQLETVCCFRRSVIASGAIGCDIALHTTATLARLLASACVWGRMSLHLSSSDSCSQGGSSNVWQQLSEVPKLWPLTQWHQLAWRASWHWLLQAAAPAVETAVGAPNSAAAVNGLHSTPSQLPPPPVVFTGYMQPSTMSMAACMCPTPEVAVVLITESAASKLIGTDVFW